MVMCVRVCCVFVYVRVRGYMGARMGCVYTSGEPFGKPQCTASTLFCQTYILARINVPRLIARSPRRTHTGRCIHCIPAKKQMRHMSQAHTSTVSDNHAHMPLTDTDRVCVFVYVCVCMCVCVNVSLVDVYCTVCGVWLMHDCTCGCVW